MLEPRQSKLDWIQALRGVAVLLVVFSHARFFAFDTPDWLWMDTLLKPGAMGVDLFFIISGFIMVYTTRGADGSAAASVDFLIKRFARVWPAYAVALLLSVLMHGFGYFLEAGQPAIFLWSLLLVPVDPTIPLFYGFAMPVAWTLAFEVYFYLVFSLAMLFGRYRWLALYAWLLATAVLAPFLLGNEELMVQARLDLPFSYLNLVTSPIVADFLAGVLIAQLYFVRWLRIPSRALCHLLVWGSAGFAIWCNYAGIATFHGPTQWGAPLALMMLCMALASKTLPMTVPQPLVWTGTISYSIYLLHTSVQFGVSLIMDRIGLATGLWGKIAITTVCIFPVAALSYRCLEKGLGGWVRNALEAFALRAGAIRPGAPQGL